MLVLRPLNFYFDTPGPLENNFIRGSLGLALKRTNCRPDCADAHTCPDRATCGYARLFEPSALKNSPSGLKHPPRPFVLRFTDNRVGVHLFDTALASAANFEAAFRWLAANRNLPLLQAEAAEPIQTPTSAEPGVTRVRIEFQTPLELKAEGRVEAGPPAFTVLFARIRDRISNLRQLYGDGPLNIDFAAMAERASQVQLTASEIRHQAGSRFSHAKKAQHPLSGITGWADYRGDLAEFMPYLRTAEWTGVGRQTVWGHGAICVRTLP